MTTNPIITGLPAEFSVCSPEETEAVGFALAEKLIRENKRRALITMHGEMGVGKTAFTRGFSARLGIRAVKSPTFTVLNEYRGDGFSVFHLDLYRLNSEDDLLSIGFDDYLDRDGFMVVEWAERLEDALPAPDVLVTIERTDDSTGRKITLT